ncbi:cell wall-binding repeat-containing protein [Ornithinibacillus halophilus]|uniref:Bacillopeptidase F n=1 Tax=Ornithinibacillus halophilus TaxID=930117 RepID=A0A1M5EAQ4_9BACI|nr:cell wall-binding repeat-containing protein [Ornithinibacillus halophilus]SHF76343.1 bacillopeptidase F [Ornithinibacillus halophilus]
MRRNYKFNRNLSLMLIIVMIIGLFAPFGTLAQPKSIDPNVQGTSQNKIQAELLEQFNEEKYVQYLVLLHDQVDSEKVALQAEKEANQLNLSKDEAKLSKRQAIVSTLQENAKKSQKNISNFLTKEKKSGKVKEFQNYFIVNGFAVKGNKASVEEIAKLPEVKSIVMDGKQQLTPIDVDDESILVADTNSDDDIEWHVDRIGAPEVWDRGITGEGTVVGNIDSGVDVNHPALLEKYRGYNPGDPDNLSHEFNWYDAASNIGSPVDSDGHGTHTMGTMVGQEADGTNKIGVAPGAKWIAARAFAHDTAYDSDIIEAAQWMLAPLDENGVPHPEMAPDVINNSWGGNPINNDWFRPMVQAWRAAEIVPVFSIGNAGLFNPGAGPGTASAPGNYPESIGVGATDENDDLASFSLKGPTESGEMKPDIAAPGVNVRSSIPGETWDTFDYDSYNGTSMAAPAVAATALLMLEADPLLTVDEIDNILKLTAVPKTNEEYTETPNNAFGYGLLDANAAVNAVEQGIATISGQVVAPGGDEIPPTFEHEPREVVFIGEEAHFTIRAMDNLSVNKVTLHIEYDDGEHVTYDTYRTEGDHLDGTYEVYLPPEHIFGELLEYWWEIEEFSGESFVSDHYEVEIKEAVTDGYVEDFESYPDGWFSFGTFNSWEWGVPEYGPEGAASGDKVMGTNLRGQYSMNSNMTLVMPPVIPEEGTQLRFNQWYSLSWFGWDKGIVYVSTDNGQTWEQVFSNTEDNENWHEVGISLSDYAGQKILVAFNLTSLDNEFPGWYIDDVQLVNNSTASTDEAPTGELTQPFAEKDNKSYPSATEVEVAEVVPMYNESLPVEATVKVVETGWETKTNPQNGEFVINHEPGEYTLEVVAYGYESHTETVTLTENGVVQPEIELTSLPKQTISGQIENSDGAAIENAQVFLLEDDNVTPVKSDVKGNYSLEALAGTYTLKVYADGYYALTEEITVVEGEPINLNIHLGAFNSTEASEIYYDNGDWDKNIVWGKEDSGFAVRMSLEEGQDAAMLTGAKLQFWAGHVPVPGGEDIRISVYDATGEDGKPGNKIAGPIDATAVRDLYQWTEVDLSEHGIVVEGDFYILYQQTDDYPYVPSFVADGDSENWTGRSWDYFGGEWYQSDQSYGNYMIRAVVDYGEQEAIPDIDTPVITSPESGLETSKQTLSLQGTASSFTTIQVLNNGEVAGTANVNKEGKFSVSVDLTEGENNLKAVSLYNGKPVKESDSVLVTFVGEKLERLSGELRYETAVEISKEGWDSSDTVVLARGTEFADALAGVPLAHSLNAPILLTRSDELYPATLEEIERLGATKVVILGGTGAINEHVEMELEGEGLNVRRIAGETRFETAARIADEVAPEGSDKVVVTNGRDFPDALSVASHAAVAGMPILLTRPDSLPDATADAVDTLGVSETYVVGGYEVVTDEVVAELPDVERLRGTNRYETNLVVNEHFGVDNNHLYVATGKHYADALAGAVLAAKNDSTIVLVSTDLPEGVADFITENHTLRLTIFGGTGAVSSTVADSLEQLLP